MAVDLRVKQALVSRYFQELRALIAGLPAGPSATLPWHPATLVAAADEPGWPPQP